MGEHNNKIINELIAIVVSEGLNVTQASALFSECAEFTGYLYHNFFEYYKSIYSQPNQNL